MRGGTVGPPCWLHRLPRSPRSLLGLSAFNFKPSTPSGSTPGLELERERELWNNKQAPRDTRVLSSLLLGQWAQLCVNLEGGTDASSRRELQLETHTSPES